MIINLGVAENILATAILAAPVIVIIERIISKKGIGVRTIQFVAVATITPALTLLAMNNLIRGETVAAIFAGLTGYLLGSISKFDERKNA